jgi:hypothetical protein
MKKLFAVACAALMFASGAAFAVPSVQQIESSMASRNWPQAESQLSEVLKAYPDNARAHYLYSEVLDREGRSAEALAQIQQAKTLDPQIRFTDASRFAQTEARIRRDAERAGGSARPSPSAYAQQGAGIAAPQRHGPPLGMWIGIAVVIAGIALVLRWTLRRARTVEDSRADDERRAQLKRATEQLNAVRTLKLDVKLSPLAGHEALEKEVEAIEAELRGLVETLSGGPNPVPPYQLDELDQRIASLKARADGRPDPAAAAAPAAGTESAYAREAERFGTPPGSYPYPPQPPQQVIVQQGGGFGGGMGGLLTGVLLGEAMNAGREREVIVDDDTRRPRDPGNGGNDDSLDFGQGPNDWDDGSGGGGGDVDLGNDDSGGWNDN